MITSNQQFLSLFAYGGALFAQAPLPVAKAPDSAIAVTEVKEVADTRAIDLVLCLDTSNSMDGLIDSARQHLWSIVNDMATLKPQPDLRVGLIVYGSPAYGAEGGFVKIATGLTQDLDLVSQQLFALQTDGGDEYVARALRRGLDQMQWSEDQQALKMVVVAGNEAATQDPQHDVAALAKEAIAGAVLVNTIFCGNPQHPDAAGWRQVSQLADGNFASIDKDQVAVITTPFDEQLSALSGEINKTYVVYGAKRGAWAANQVAQDSNAVSLNSAAAAQRCVTKASVLYCNPQNDLVDACKQKDFVLSEVKKEDLPEALRKLSLAELQAHVDAQGKKRGALQKQVAELAKRREAFVKQQLEQSGNDQKRLFERVMLESIRAQACSRGFRREQPKAAGPADKPQGEGSAVDARFVEVFERIQKDYLRFHRVTGAPRHAPTDCFIRGPYARTSNAEREHGGKLYLLYARHAVGEQYVTEGQPAKVGQSLVKESWQRVAGVQKGPTEASRRYPGGLTLRDEVGAFHAGSAHGLFVMHKLEKGTPGTDDGWVYGTFDKAGKLTAAGRVASCMKCHEDAENDRRFGLQ